MVSSPDGPSHCILFGTTNPAKIEIVKAFLETLPVELISLADLDIHISVPEDGQSPEENAEKKARAYFDIAQMPTFAIDAALSIQGFPPEKQPGVYVRRIFGAGQEVSDREILNYYIHELEQVGGEGVAIWRVALAFIAFAGQISVRTYSFEAQIVSKPSQRLLPGAPLSSLMIDPRTGKYFSETDHRQRVDARWVKQIMQENLAALSTAQPGSSAQERRCCSNMPVPDSPDALQS